MMLRGVLALSERRASFVSAVTHELRSPLTTFRMYAEMLAEGMVRDEQQRDRYLSTLRQEADRLSHLVDNVLQYARLGTRTQRHDVASRSRMKRIDAADNRTLAATGAARPAWNCTKRSPRKMPKPWS